MVSRMRGARQMVAGCVASLVVLLAGRPLVAQTKGAEAAAPPPAAAAEKSTGETAQAPEGLVKISKTNDVWIDTKRKAVVVDGQVCLREGALEMFACPKGTKEHESVVSLNCLAQEVHAALLAVGAKPGAPAVFDPEYKPATGQIIDVYVLWKDEQGGKHQARAQDWVKSTRTGKPLAYSWVFAGSGFWKDPETGKEFYKADSGDLICVSNFPTATLDLPIPSSQANDDLMYQAFTDNVPPRGTKIRVVLIPRPEKTEAKQP